MLAEPTPGVLTDTDRTAIVRALIEQARQIELTIKAERPEDQDLQVTTPKIDLAIRIASVKSKLGDQSASRTTLQQAVDDAQTLNRRYRTEALNSLAKAYWDIGEREKAEMLLAEELDFIQKAPDFSNPDASLRLVLTLAETGHVQKALEIAGAINHGEFQAIGLHYIAEAQVSAGDINGALKTADKIMKEGGYQDRAFMWIAMGQFFVLKDKKGGLKTANTLEEPTRTILLYEIAGRESVEIRPENAAETIWELFHFGENEDPRPDPVYFYQVQLLLTTAFGQNKVGDAEASAKAIDQAVQISQKISNPIGKDEALKDIAVVQARVGRVQEALDTQEKIQNTLVRGTALNKISYAQLQSGDLEGAVQTAKRIPDFVAFLKIDVLQRIAVAQYMAGNPDRAFRTLDEMSYHYPKVVSLPMTWDQLWTKAVGRVMLGEGILEQMENR